MNLITPTTVLYVLHKSLYYIWKKYIVLVIWKVPVPVTQYGAILGSYFCLERWFLMRNEQVIAWVKSVCWYVVGIVPFILTHLSAGQHLHHRAACDSPSLLSTWTIAGQRLNSNWGCHCTMWEGPDRQFISKPINMIYGAGEAQDWPINTKAAPSEARCYRGALHCTVLARSQHAFINGVTVFSSPRPLPLGQEFKAQPEELNARVWTLNPLNVTGRQVGKWL